MHLTRQWLTKELVIFLTYSIFVMGKFDAHSSLILSVTDDSHIAVLVNLHDDEFKD